MKKYNQGFNLDTRKPYTLVWSVGVAQCGLSLCTSKFGLYHPLAVNKSLDLSVLLFSPL